VKTLRFNVLLWFGILGGPLAWATGFVAAYGFALAQCNPPVTRWQLPVHGWQIGLAIGALVVGLAATGVSLGVFLRTRNIDDVMKDELMGEGHVPPLGRVHFLSIVGLTVNFLALSIVVICGIGAPLLTVCRQS
jgi:hypothetical protein